ncbi:MAG TPA: erythromycin esterase family protein [Thermoanaerobaculia bacterium]|nr:erythromycin esterase family protein [Thermoanaerobaculia bacterium]
MTRSFARALRDSHARTVLVAAVTCCLLAPSALAQTRARAARPMEEPPAQWLAANASPLATLEPSASDDDLRPLLPVISGARMIALSDATHGTHEFYSLKQRLIPFLVASANVRTIVFEAPYAEFERISEYVRTGKGDPAELLKSSDYFFWDTEEILELIRWVRGWNESGRAPLNIVGVDCFHPATSIEVVLEYLRRVDSAAAADAEQRYSCLASRGDAPLLYAAQLDSHRNSCRDSVRSVRALIERGRGDYVRRTSTEEIARVLYAARLVEQGEESFATLMGNRDEAMAENIEWLLNRTDANLVILGHNEHFGKTPYTLYREEGDASVGSILAARHGSRYAAIGTVALQGFFNAMFFENGSGSIGVYPMAPASPADYATLLSAGPHAAMIVPLRAPLPSWLAQSRPIRIAGSTIISRRQTTVELTVPLAKRFDAVIYVENSTPTRMRHWPIAR